MKIFLSSIGLDENDLNFYRWIYGDDAINCNTRIGDVINYEQDGDTIYVKWFSLSG